MTRRLALVIAAALLLASHAALARPKVALTQIEGDTTGDVHEAVAEALEGNELSLIGSREVNRAVDKLGDLADLTEKDFKKLANELEADAIVAGKLDKVGTAKTLRFRLFVHKKMAKGFTVSFKDPKSEKFRSMLHDKMLDKIGAAAGGDDEDARPGEKKKAAEDEEDPLATKKDKKAKKSKASDDEEEARPAKKGKLAKSDGKAADEAAGPARKAKADDAARSDDAAKSDDDDAPRRAKKKVAAADDADDLEVGASAGRSSGARPASRAAIRLDIGASVQQRSFKFNSNVAGLPRNARRASPGRLDSAAWGQDPSTKYTTTAAPLPRTGGLPRGRAPGPG